LEVDHTLLDWHVLCDITGLPLGRPTLTIIVDSFSKHIVGLYVSFNGPSVPSVLKAVKHSILPKASIGEAAGLQRPWIPFGVGETFLLDNGMEFHSATFQRVAMSLGVDVEYCPVRAPWVKPNVERAFLDLDFVRVAQGRVIKHGSDAIPADPSNCAVIPFSRFVKGLVIWAADIHGHQVNRRTLCRPAQVYEESISLAPAPTMPKTFESLDLIAAMSMRRRVSAGGVDRRGITWAGPELKEVLLDAGGPFTGSIKWDPDNLDITYVQNPRSLQWHALRSTRPDFTRGLTEHQLRVIRRAMTKDAKRRDIVDAMIRSRDALREAWLEPLARQNIKVDPRQARQYAAVSATALRIESASPKPQAVISPEDLAGYDAADIPDFEYDAL
jgi:putative transposase